MTTWVEARSAKTERQRREHRYFNPDNLGRACPFCKAKMPTALLDAGINAHPTCGPDAAAIMAGAR